MAHITRRRLLSSCAGILAIPAISTPARAMDVDVVVIGAGAAGISATRQLRKRGLKVSLIEAADRIGGRVHTDKDIFGVPYDTGAHWLHQRETNPFADYGEQNGFSIYRAPVDEVLQIGDRKATAEETEAFRTARRMANSAISKAGSRSEDVAPSSVVPSLGEWYHTAHLAVGPYEMAKDFDHFSCADWYTGEDGTDFYCREGFGALFAHSARDVAVTLKTKANAIRWAGQGVEVETTGGTITAKAAVVTVSVGVLAQGGIKFTPKLPDKVTTAFNELTMGHYSHVALKFRDNFFGIGEDGYFHYKVDRESNGSPNGFVALIDAAGTGVSYCDIGGDFAYQMAQAGDAATLDFVKYELKKMFGSRVEKALIGADVAEWSTNPLTQGSYASAEPGGAGARRVLRENIAKRIWFAGEALSLDDWATVAGAHKSGQQVGNAVAAVIKG